MHHIYSAPNCIRCKIVKGFITSRNETYNETDFQEQKEEFNAFYRANRPSIYRNPEGVEFPIYTDGQAIKQGSGEVIAYLLSGHEMECCVTRSDLLHGWIAGLYPSSCPEEHTQNFITLVESLSKGGLQICIRSDGRNPQLLKTLIEKNLVQKLEVNFIGPKTVYLSQYNFAPTPEDIALTLELAKKVPSSIRLQILPLKENDTYRYLTKEEATQAAQMIAEAANDKQLPILIARLEGEELAAVKLDKKLEELSDQDLFKYRSGARDFLFKTDIYKG